MKTGIDTAQPSAAVIADSKTLAWTNKRFLGWCIYLVVLSSAFALPLQKLARFAAHSDVHSYILLIPFVTAYLISIRWQQLSDRLTTSWGPAGLLATVGATALIANRFVEL